VSVSALAKGTVLHDGVGPAPSLVMLYQGQLEVSMTMPGGPTATRTLSPGGFAGGVSMLRPDVGERVVCTTSCLVVLADGEDAFPLFESVPSLHALVALHAYGRAAPLEAVLHHPALKAAFLAFQQSECANHRPHARRRSLLPEPSPSPGARPRLLPSPSSSPRGTPPPQLALARPTPRGRVRAECPSRASPPPRNAPAAPPS
jgi:hypothetical protein